MFDDDTFTDFKPRVEEIARGLGKLGVMWSCNAKANVPFATLKIMKENGLRLLLVGYESGDDQILLNVKKGLRTDMARRFSDDCRKARHQDPRHVLPGETRERSRRPSHSPKRSIRTRSRCRWRRPTRVRRCTSRRSRMAGCRKARSSISSVPRASSCRQSATRTCRAKRSTTAWKNSISASISGPSKIWEIVREMLVSWDMMKRRLQEGVEFFRFLRAHQA